MPKYALEIGGKTYDIESERPLSDSDLAAYARKPRPQRPRGRSRALGRIALRRLQRCRLAGNFCKERNETFRP